jgi:hypothetical protein
MAGNPHALANVFTVSIISMTGLAFHGRNGSTIKFGIKR